MEFEIQGPCNPETLYICMSLGGWGVGGGGDVSDALYCRALLLFGGSAYVKKKLE